MAVDETAKTVKELLIELGEKVDNVADKLDRLDVVVRGDEAYNTMGLVSEVRDLRARVAALERFRDRAIWTSIGLGAASGGALSLIVKTLFGG